MLAVALGLAGGVADTGGVASLPPVTAGPGAVLAELPPVAGGAPGEPGAPGAPDPPGATVDAGADDGAVVVTDVDDVVLVVLVVLLSPDSPLLPHAAASGTSTNVKAAQAIMDPRWKVISSVLKSVWKSGCPIRRTTTSRLARPIPVN